MATDQIVRLTEFESGSGPLKTQARDPSCIHVCKYDFVVTTDSWTRIRKKQTLVSSLESDTLNIK